MGEARLKQSATQKFIAQYPACCFCAGMRAATTREHAAQIALRQLSSARQAGHASVRSATAEQARLTRRRDRQSVGDENNEQSIRSRKLVRGCSRHQQ
jgi:hypothetical protein